LPDAFADEFVKSYVRLNLDVKLSGHIDKGMVGKVIGKAGRRLREIRRRAGALVRIHKAENGNAKQVGVQ
jgi:predicted PilT family ATPase